jgi:hypothetical protein
MMIRLVRVLNCADFVLKGVYHNGCMTKYLLKCSPKNEQKQDSDLSSNEIAFQNLIHEINDDLAKSAQFNTRTSLIIILTQSALHQLVHTLTGCNCMYFKIFLECFILTNETKIPLNGLVLAACYNTCL